MGHHQLDTLDEQILKLIADNARIPFLEVARACNVSGAAIHQRIQKLTNLGILKGSEYVIDPEKIGDVVGQRGKTINAIIERTGVQIDITDEGAVSICGVDQHGMDEAKKMIKTIATDFEAGQIFTGKVVSIKEFGAFVEFAPGKEGMVHISKICKERINRVEDVLTLGDKVKVICLGKDKMGRISFSMKDVPEEA